MIIIKPLENVPNDTKPEYSRNVELIRQEKVRMIKARIPRVIRKELQHAVKAGCLGRLKKDRLKPEVFYHPDYEQDAIDCQINAALYAIQCISKIVVGN